VRGKSRHKTEFLQGRHQLAERHLSTTGQGDGEASFPDAENFVVRSSGASTVEGKTVTSTSTKTAKWLSADCGDIKPMDSQP